MTLFKRLKLLVKYTNFQVLVIISLLYGLFFGSLFNMGSFIDKEVSWGEFIFTNYATAGVYYTIFAFALIIIYILTVTKLFKSMSVSETLLITFWHDLLIFTSVLNTIIYISLIFLGLHYSDYTIRVLNMDLNNMSAIQILGLIFLIWVVNQLLLQILSLVSNIGNRYGAYYAFSALALTFAVLVLSMLPVIDTIIWGSYPLLRFIVPTVLVIVLYSINIRLIKHIEVTR